MDLASQETGLSLLVLWHNYINTSTMFITLRSHQHSGVTLLYLSCSARNVIFVSEQPWFYREQAHR